MGDDWKKYMVSKEKDDWTQMEDVVARKRAQNRLAQRAHRQRYGRQKRSAHGSVGTTTHNATSVQRSTDSGQLQHVIRPATTLFNPRVFSPLIESHLMTSTGALPAILTNSTILGIDCAPGPRLKTIYLSSSQLTPPSLRPTTLQLQQAHLPYIDLLPFPTLRDNLLRAGDSLSALEFWTDLSNHVRVWGSTPWDKRGWEVRDYFFVKWWWVLSEEVIDEANFWRVSRGEDHLDLETVRAGVTSGGIIV